MLGEGHPIVQGIGQFLRNETFRLQLLEQRTHSGGEILPKHSDANPFGAGIFPRRILWHGLPPLRQSKFIQIKLNWLQSNNSNLLIILLKEQTIRLSGLGI